MLCRHAQQTTFLLEMWRHRADEFKKLEWKLPQNSPKWATLVLKQQNKNFQKSAKIPILVRLKNANTEKLSEHQELSDELG